MSGSGRQTRRDSNKQAAKKANEQRAPKALKRKQNQQSFFFGERLKARKVTGESCQSEANSKSGFNSIAASSGNDADDENTASQSQTDLNVCQDEEYSVCYSFM